MSPLEATLESPALAGSTLSIPGEKAPTPVTLLSAENSQAEFECGDFIVTYFLDTKHSTVGLRLLPRSKVSKVVEPRVHLETPEMLALPDWCQPVYASHGESSLIQLKLAEDDSGAGFSGGRSMRFNPTVQGLRLMDQSFEELADGFIVRTRLKGTRDFICTHVLVYRTGDQAVTVHVEFENTGNEKLTLEMLSSFSFGNLSPFDNQDSVERLKIHRFRSLWSSEGRHEAISLEDLHLERSWGLAAVVNERFGQVGSMPVRGFFPFAAIQDFKENVFWGAQLACPSSWQIEVYRKDDKISLSGGLADREFGHWMKSVQPGEIFVTPQAFLSTSTGNLDSFCQRLSRMQGRPLEKVPAAEMELPIIFNEWCSTWGTPTPKHIEETATILSRLPVSIFVIDDGWAEKPEKAAQFNGDWNVELKRFPHGLQPVADLLKKKGFIPGLWFEFEVCTEGTDAFKLNDHKLRRDGRILKVGSRHFWDFTDPWTFAYLTEKVIDRLRNDGFGYLKVDYNDTIGLGCDDPDSLGEGLRKHILGVQRFFEKLRREIPDLIIETCSSGGHRLEPSMLALASMASFSDSHETLDIPIIAANLHRLILPRQSQIWAVLHSSDSSHRLFYSLAACFLGRMCLSGEIATLGKDQLLLLDEALNFYRSVAPIIRNGESHIFRQTNKSYRNPRGWQVVVRQSREEPGDLLVVAHSFEKSAGSDFEISLPPGQWTAVRGMARGITSTLEKDGSLLFKVSDDFASYVGHFKAV